MSASFEAFVRQFGSRDRLHGEGYSYAMFCGLSDSELRAAIEMLESAALDGDATAVDGLKYIEGPDASAAIRNVVSKAHNPAVAILAMQALYERSGDDSFLRTIVGFIGSNDSYVRWHALQAIPVAPPKDPTIVSLLLSELSKILLRDGDLVERNLAAKRVLAIAGISQKHAKYAEWIKTLSASPIEERENTLREIMGPLAVGQDRP